MNVFLRPAEEKDVSSCAEICCEAFTEIAKRHGFPSDFPNNEAAAALIGPMIEHPCFYGVIGEIAHEIVGSNFLDERGEVVGLGPITVSVAGQNGQVGRLLMQHCLDRCESRDVMGVRLLQAAYHNRSLALYTNLGFTVRDVVSTLQGPAIHAQVENVSVRSAMPRDVEACERLHLEVHGHGRKRELEEAIGNGTARIAEENGRLIAYCSAMGFGGFAVSRSNKGLEALIANADEFFGPGILVPSSNGEVMRWCLNQGLKIVQQSQAIKWFHFHTRHLFRSS